MENSREDQCRFAKHFERAQGWLLLDKAGLAAAALQEIPLAFQQRPEVKHFRAHLHLSVGEWALAEPVLRQLRDAEPDEPHSWVNLAFAVRRSTSIAAAELILQEGRQRFPAVALIWFNLACYAAQQARLGEVGALLGEAFRLEPGLKAQAKTDSDLAPYWTGLASGEIAPWL